MIEMNRLGFVTQPNLQLKNSESDPNRRCYMKSLYAMIIIYLCAPLAFGAIDDSLVLHLAFDEGSGDKISDDSMYSNHGALVGKAEWVAGKSGKGIVFNINGDSVIVKNSDSLSITMAITMEMWVKLGGGAEIKQAGIEKGGWEGGEYSIYPFYEGGTVIQFFDLPAACGDAVIKGKSIQDNQWHYMAGTWDGSKISLYIDGDLERSGDCSGKLLRSAQPVYIGSRNGGERFLVGTVDEVRIYNRALTQDEVKKDMQTFGPLSVYPSQKLTTCWGDVKQQ